MKTKTKLSSVFIALVMAIHMTTIVSSASTPYSLNFFLTYIPNRPSNLNHTQCSVVIKARNTAPTLYLNITNYYSNSSNTYLKVSSTYLPDDLIIDYAGLYSLYFPDNVSVGTDITINLEIINYFEGSVSITGSLSN